MVKYVYELSFELPYTIKYEYRNNGLFASTLNNVVLMDFPAYSRLLSNFLIENLFKNTELKTLLFEQLDKSSLDKSEVTFLKISYEAAIRSEESKKTL